MRYQRVHVGETSKGSSNFIECPSFECPGLLVLVVCCAVEVLQASFIRKGDMIM